MTVHRYPVRSIPELKGLARSLKHELGVPHQEALDIVAVRSGFQNYVHAQRSLQDDQLSAAPQVLFPVHLTALWADRDHRTAGQEHLTIDLPVALRTLIPDARILLRNRGLRPADLVADDCLRLREPYRSQHAARADICEAARTLEFMAATGLRPSLAFRMVPAARHEAGMPDRDHYSVWVDPVSGRHLMTDEPYGDPQVKLALRRTWATAHGHDVVLSPWGGMYAPPPDVGSHLFLISELARGLPIAPVAAVLATLPPPPTAVSWTGRTLPFKDAFESPAMVAKRLSAAPLAAQHSSPRRRRGSSDQLAKAYGLQPARHHSAVMPLQGHQEVGRHIRAILGQSMGRKSVYGAVNALRDVLDGWFQQEHRGAGLTQSVATDVYHDAIGTIVYHQSLPPATRTMMQGHFDEVRKVLRSHYPGGASLSRILAKLTVAENALARWV